ncbi:MAG TPA: sensor histidine kinase, partial [Saprospiraceae bacterium]|nr:sensor histidine kinase [Saprospiraceae bacterium]
MTASRFLDTLYEFISRRPVYHGLFWVVLFAVMVTTGYNNTTASLGFILSNELVALAFYAVLVYFNLLYLIPNYLARHAFFYLTLMLLACALATPLEVLVMYLKFSDWPQLRAQLVQNQFGVFLGNVLVTLLSTVMRVIMDWWRYQNEKQVLLTQTMQSELRFLKSQINPHFLFNTLNNLYALTLKKSDAAPTIVLKLSEIMRYMLYECNERRVLLSKEIQYIHNYLDLERLRQPKEAEISFVAEGHISDQMVAPLLFVPFLENSFKHGLNHYVKGGGFVRLRLSVSGEDLEFYAENSKADARPTLDHPRSGGIGLVNLRARLELLYPGEH